MEKAIVCFSGGHASALTAIETVRRYGKERVILLNHNISSHVEHEDIKRFKQDVADYLDIPITYANMDHYEEMTPLKVCLWQNTIFAGRPGQALCTYYLKTQPFYKFLERYPKSKDIHIIYGFSEDEQNRIHRRTDVIRAMGYTPEFPIADWPRTIECTESIGIPLPVTYKIYKHANCAGCLKAGRQHWYCIYCLRHDIWEEAKSVERQLGYSIIQGAYLEELEPKFKIMRDDKGIRSSQKMHPNTFWAQVNKVLSGEISAIPCDCAI